MQKLKLISDIETIEIEKTMTSLELVELINQVRKIEFEEGKSKKFIKLRHADFLTKVPEVLGKLTSENFRSSYKDAKGETRPCYKFHEREAWLMAMSYSYSLQAYIYDKLQEAFACNHDLRSILDKLTLLQSKVMLNGSQWGKMGNEQKKNKRTIQGAIDALSDIAQSKLFH